ncbi:TrlF family AAA-like ATPase [Psychrobacillus sp. NPDC096426]|uniref:TrlF family AAA-like ATPase n=1 Tax=Psychrobacillus sp. NPDC096426 TaxID=3364491 RepID=UPI00381B4ADE
MEVFRGLRWYKCDLHLHTTVSECFRDKTITAEQWIQKCIDEGLQCVAVTDHNTGDGIDEIKTAAEGKIIVFPGVEVTCGDSKQHVLIIFDPSKNSSYVNEFLTYIGIFGEDRAKESTSTNLSIFEVAEKANERGGLAIAAHIDQFAGLSPLSHEHKEAVCLDKNIFGVQVVHDFLYQSSLPAEEELQRLFDDLYNQVGVDIWKPWVKTAQFYRDKPIAKLTFSDNPAADKDPKHGLNGIGSRFSWIKMNEEITIESLKQALLMPNIRIINDFDYIEDTKFNSDTYIKDLEILDTIYNLGNRNVINFNPQLTTIIGGRGTGKSGILRLMRNTLNMVDDLKKHEDILRDHSEFCSKNSGDLGVFTDHTKTRMKIVVGESKYILSFNFNSGVPKYGLTVEYSNGETSEIPSDEIAEFLERLNIKLFSQKQIYDISRRSDALRNFIDSSITEVEGKKQTLKNLENNYNNNLFKIVELEKSLSKNSSLEVRLKELEIENEKINVPEVIEILENDKKFTEENESFKLLIESVDTKIEALKNILNSNIDFINKEQFRAEYEEDINLINSSIEGFLTSHDDLLLREIKSLEDFKETLRFSLDTSKWISNFKEHKQKLEVKQHEQGNMNQLLTHRKQITDEIHMIQKLLVELKEVETKITSLKKENQENIQAILGNRRDIRTLRHSFINNVLEDNQLLKGDVKAFRDYKNYEQILREHLLKPTGFDSDFEKIIEFIKEGNTLQKLTELVNIIRDMSNNGVNSLELSGKFVKVLQNLEKQKIESLEILLPEDEVVMLYKVSERANFTPLSNASAGQKTSAILTLILSTGDSPLILDQPEDDLDNSLIYSLIVDRIIKSKNNRQIIIVTHNANIPVNADSDLVNVMDSNGLTFNPKNFGSIDEHDIKESICSIMEGGINAFKSRAVKYDLKLI